MIRRALTTLVDLAANAVLFLLDRWPDEPIGLVPTEKAAEVEDYDDKVQRKADERLNLYGDEDLSEWDREYVARGEA